MSDERKPPDLNQTKRPPSGGDSSDIYSAETKVGKAPEDLLALVRAAEEAATAPRPLSDDAPTVIAADAEEEEVPTRVGQVQLPAELIERARLAAQQPEGSLQERVEKALHRAPETSDASPVIPNVAGEDDEGSVPPPISSRGRQHEPPEHRPVLRSVPPPPAVAPPEKSFIPPAVAIVLVFALAIVLLAALVR